MNFANRIPLVVSIIFLISAACTVGPGGPDEAEIDDTVQTAVAEAILTAAPAATPDIESTIAAAIAANATSTAARAPTPTTTPDPSPVPIATLAPSPTPSPTSTSVRVPTATPRSAVTATPLSVPTATPRPVGTSVPTGGNNQVIASRGQIAFASDHDGNIDIYVMDADGSNQIRLTDNAATDTVPTWSPDRKKIAFRSDRDGNFEIYVMDIDGSNLTRLTDNAATEWEPDWSPDGRQIAFSSDRDGNHEIYVMDIDGSNRTRLTNHSFRDQNPAWSPDGQKILFLSASGTNDVMYIMDADGSNPVSLSGGGEDDQFPAWSPDGKKIAFSSFSSGFTNREIYVINADGTGEIRLTDTPANEEYVGWSPDGEKIAFVSERDGNAEIYVMDADGSNQTRLTNTPGAEHDLEWSPGPAPIQPLPGLVAWWPGDGNANDIIGDNDGTLTGNATYAPGMVGQAFSFDGTGGTDGAEGIVFIPDAQELNPSEATGFTVEAWATSNSTDGNPAVVAKGEMFPNEQYGIDIYRGHWRAWVRDSPGSAYTIGDSRFDPTRGIPVVPGQFVHLALSWDGALFSFFVNGVLHPQQGPVTVSDGGNLISPGPVHPTAILTNGGFLGIGGRASRSQDDLHFDGLVDEVKIYDRALTADEVKAIFDAGSAGMIKPPVALWSADGNAEDSIGGNDGTLVGGVTFAEGVVGQAFSFDGVSGEIVLNHSSALDFGPNDSFSVLAWVNPTLPFLAPPFPQGEGAVISLTYQCTAELIELEIVGDRGEIPKFSIRDHLDVVASAASPDPLVTGQWRHLVGVRDVSTDRVELYIDGVLVSSVIDATTGTFTRADSFGNEPDRIGSVAVPCASNRFYRGLIDEVAIYDQALSHGQIAAIYNAGLAELNKP